MSQGTELDVEHFSSDGDDGKSPLISRTWLQITALVFLIGFTILGVLAVRTYQATPPVPSQVVSESGDVIFTSDDINDGQGIFVANGLMEYGSIFGHGAYLGPDYSAEYLNDAVANATKLKSGPTAAQDTLQEFRENRYDEASDTLVYTADQEAAFEQAVKKYGDFFGDPTTANALRPEVITDPEDIRKMTAFFSWTGWVAAAERPGESYSYTNNWPPDASVGNTPTAPTLMWSTLSLISLVAGIGILMAIFGRWEKQIGWQSGEGPKIRLRRPDSVALTPSQRATVFMFVLVAGMFLVQTLVGGAAAHFRSDPSGFFGFDLAQWLPFNLARTWHLQLAIFWVATSFLAAGLYLAPMLSGREPKKQHWLVYGLIGALGIVVIGSMIGEYLGIHGLTEGAGQFFANQGFEYLDLGRFWQILLIIGLVFWVIILYRGLRKQLIADKRINLPWIFFFSALSIPMFYAVSLLVRTDASFSINDFWRFWMVHLWVEEFLELFVTVMVAFIFVILGVTTKKLALRLIFLDIIIYSIGGVVGTMHHVYFSGNPQEFMALGAVFSALEVMPLTLLTVEAWRFTQMRRDRVISDGKPFIHKWALWFFIAVGFWNFVGAGVLGFLINMPVVSYYEIGTALTANHAHAAFMGVYGMMAVGLLLFCTRYMIPEKQWPERLAKISFFSMNLGLVWIIVITLFPLGVMQMWTSVEEGYNAARSPEFLAGTAQNIVEWLRIVGDSAIIIGGALPLLWICWLAVKAFFQTKPSDEPVSMLYDVEAPEEEEEMQNAPG